MYFTHSRFRLILGHGYWFSLGGPKVFLEEKPSTNSYAIPSFHSKKCYPFTFIYMSHFGVLVKALNENQESISSDPTLGKKPAGWPSLFLSPKKASHFWKIFWRKQQGLIEVDSWTQRHAQTSPSQIICIGLHVCIVAIVWMFSRSNPTTVWLL